LIVIGAFAAPVLRMTTQMPTAAVLPSEAEYRQGYEVLTREFDMGELTPINVALSWDGDPDPLAASRLPALANFGRLLASQQDVRSVTSVANLPHVDSPLALVFFWQTVKPALETGEAVRIGSREISAEQIAGLQQLTKATTAPGIVVYRVAPKADPSSATASDLVERLRRLTPPDGMTLSIAGESAARLDFYDGLTGRFPWVAASIIIATFVILVLLTHSLVVPLKAIVVNTFTILMAWGTIVYIFQDGHFERVLRFTSSGAVDAIMPIIIFCTLYGVSMDYEVFLLARMHECWRRTHNSQQSVAAGLTCSGRVIVSAAALVVVVAGSFAFTSISMTKTLGIGIAFAIALDALFVRMMLVPAIMRLAGRWSWWLPGRLNHRLPDLGEG
ncbi:MAG: MMPL family transporter, partial [Actinobacteria bacterium]|nr:MMPL family transporter [Actinomycetota bacterium]